MAYKLIRTQTALSELDGIVYYLAVKLANSFAAGELLDGVEDVISSLSDMPRLYPPVATERFAKAGFRKALIKNYVCIYKVDDVAKEVHILHFFHASQDYERYI